FNSVTNHCARCAPTIQKFIQRKEPWPKNNRTESATTVLNYTTDSIHRIFAPLGFFGVGLEIVILTLTGLLFALLPPLTAFVILFPLTFAKIGAGGVTIEFFILFFATFRLWIYAQDCFR